MGPPAAAMVAGMDLDSNFDISVGTRANRPWETAVVAMYLTEAAMVAEVGEVSKRGILPYTWEGGARTFRGNLEHVQR